MHESFTPYSLLELSDLIEHGRGANGTICEVSIKVVNGSNDPSDPTHPTRLIQPDRKIGIMKHKGNLIGPIALTVKRFWEIFPFEGDKSSIPEILFVIIIFYIWIQPIQPTY